MKFNFIYLCFLLSIFNFVTTVPLISLRNAFSFQFNEFNFDVNYSLLTLYMSTIYKVVFPRSDISDLPSQPALALFVTSSLIFDSQSCTAIYMRIQIENLSCLFTVCLVSLTTRALSLELLVYLLKQTTGIIFIRSCLGLCECLLYNFNVTFWFF